MTALRAFFFFSLDGDRRRPMAANLAYMAPIQPQSSVIVAGFAFAVAELSPDFVAAACAVAEQSFFT